MQAKSPSTTTAATAPYDLIDIEMQFLSRLMTIIESQQWDVLGHAILNNQEVFRTFARSIASSPSQHLNGMTILHATVRYNPPPELVQILLDLVPESPTCIDIARRTPLHIAVGMRANPSTVELLVRAYPNACAMLDWEGKTPLHLACDDGFNLFNEEDNDTTTTIERPKHCLDTIRTLINACPLAAVVEDQDDMTALEHAIMSDASIKVVGLLQGITCRQSMKVRSFVKKISEESSIVSEEPKQQLSSRSLSL